MSRRNGVRYAEQQNGEGSRTPNNRPFRRWHQAVGVWLVMGLTSSFASALAGPKAVDEELAGLYAETIRAAVAKVRPALVRIETAGGFEQVGKVLRGTGPTTGLIVGEDGWILTSAFNLSHRPTGILVLTVDGKRRPARIVGTDHACRLMLLKVDAKGLAVARAAPKEGIAVGQTAIALGLGLGSDEPAISVGIVSAVQRIWGRAVQTDAKVSPVNYGGPLIDLEGRVLGVLAPLSPSGTDVAAGTEWYDSGIGFAVPLAEIQQRLPRLQKGDLHPGLLGITYRSNNLLAEPTIAQVRWRSPAAQLGLEPGDRLTELDGRPVKRLAEIRHAIGPKYAGDVLEVAYERKGQTRRGVLTLVKDMPVYARPFLGIRLAASTPPGVIVAEVIPNSPAAQAGIRTGDLWISAAMTPVASREQAEAVLDRFQPGEKMTCEFERDGKASHVTLTVGSFPEALPPPLPGAEAAPAPAEQAIEIRRDNSFGEIGLVGRLEGPARSQGLILWFLESEKPAQRDALLSAWKEPAARGGIVVAAIAPRSPLGWRSADLQRAKSALDLLTASQSIDPSRIVVAGQAAAAAAAERLALDHRQRIRGVVLIDGGRLQAPPTDPREKLAYFVVQTTSSTESQRLSLQAERLRRQKHPLRLQQLAERTPEADIGLRHELVSWNRLLSAL